MFELTSQSHRRRGRIITLQSHFTAEPNHIISGSAQVCDIIYGLSDDKVAQLDLSSHGISCNFSTIFNANFDNYLPLFGLTCFLLPFVFMLAHCYNLHCIFPLYGNTAFLLCTMMMDFVPMLCAIIGSITEPLFSSIQPTFTFIQTLLLALSWQAYLGPLLWLSLIFITKYHPGFVTFTPALVLRAM